MNSVYEKMGRYVNGGKTETTKSTLGWWERKKIPEDTTDMTYTLEKVYENRPEKLAGVLYGDTRLWWLILQFNNILDIQEEFVEGKQLRLPTKDRVYSDLLSGKTGGIPSTRTNTPKV